MDHKQYTEAKKIVSIKPKENYMVIDIYYNHKIILPYKDGLAMLAALANAEAVNEEYNKPMIISGFNREHLKTSIMSGEDYGYHKMAALLNITLDEIKEYEKLAA